MGPRGAVEWACQIFPSDAPQERIEAKPWVVTSRLALPSVDHVGEGREGP